MREKIFDEILHISGVVRVSRDKDEYIVRQGDAVRYVFYIISGNIKREIVTEDGVELSVIGHFRGKQGWNSFLGLLSPFGKDENPRYNASFLTASKCVYYQIPTIEWLDYLDQNPQYWRKVLDLAMQEYYRVHQLFEMKLQRQAANSLCKILLDQVELIDGVYYIVGQGLKNVELAKRIGIHKVTSARILKQLQIECVITKKQRQMIVLDIEALTAYAEKNKELKYRK